MLKKIIVYTCLIIGLGALILGTLSRKSDNFEHIQFASWGSESEVNILKPIIKDFENKNNGIKVDFMYIPQNYFQKLHLLFASNTPPDVVFINNLNLPVFANAGMLEDLTPYSEDFESDKYFPQSLKSLSWHGILYAIPRDVSNTAVFYNKYLFKKYGVPYPQNNWDLNDLLNKAVRISHPQNQIYGISFDELPLLYLPYLLAYGGWSKEDTLNYFKKDVLNKIPNKKGLQFYANLRKKYHAAPSKSEIASATSAQMFLQGKIAMQVSGRWLVPKYRQEAKFDWDIVQFPSANKSTKSKVFMDSSGWAISKNSKHKKAALKLIMYLSSKESSQRFSETGLIVPARKDCAYSKYFLDKQMPHNSKAFLDAAQNSVPTPVTLDYPEITDSLKSRVEHLFN